MFLWRFHEAVAGSRIDELCRIASSFGDSFQRVAGRLRELPPPPPPDEREEGGLALTTLQDARTLGAGEWLAPRLLYFSHRAYDVSFYLSKLPADLPFLNRFALFSPFGLLSSSPFVSTLIEQGGGRLFVRPDSGLKPFPGCSIKVCDFDDVSRLVLSETGARVEPERLVCVSPFVALDEVEWRFWIVERKVVAFSPYSWERDVPRPLEPPPQAFELARRLAEAPWQPDVAYVADVVSRADDGSYLLNEINAASTSGLYDVELDKLLPALREAVVREKEGLVSRED